MNFPRILRGAQLLACLGALACSQQAADSPDEMSSLVSQLRSLSELREAGALTDEEFQAAKAALLAKQNVGGALDVASGVAGVPAAAAAPPAPATPPAPAPPAAAPETAPVATAAAATPSQKRKMILVGIDGAEWSVIKELWARGDLPTFKKLVDEGLSSPLDTPYGKSPVVWTSVATGVEAETHGITDFALTVNGKSSLASSEHRKVPALWNLISDAGRRVALLGWWASWPAETLNNGVVLTDRVQFDVDRKMGPASDKQMLTEELGLANRNQVNFPGSDLNSPQDRAMAHFSQKFSADPNYDFIISYFRGTDMASHKYWACFRPNEFDASDLADHYTPEQLEECAKHIPRKYSEVDKALADILEASGDANLVIVSDHGFFAHGKVLARVVLDSDALLKQIGLLNYSDGKTIDFSKTKVYTHNTNVDKLRKKMRFALAGREAGAVLTEGEKERVLASLEDRLAKITYTSGKPVLKLVERRPHEEKEGADFILEVFDVGVSTDLMIDGKPVSEIIERINLHSGGHGGHPPPDGIFIAYGPDVNRSADLTDITIYDVAPTILGALDIPVPSQMVGKMRSDVFVANNDGYEDQMLDELKSLGYMAE